MMSSSVSGPAARAEDVVKRYGSGPAVVTALAGVSVEIPAGQILLYLAAAALAGLLAAIAPARRAARMNMLTAIAAE